MKVSATALPEVLLIEPRIFSDDRGRFMETYNAARYREAGIDVSFVQDNLSYSRKGVLRGLHYQQPNAQGKLVQVVVGEVYDVAVDIRQGSPRFGQWVGVTLSSSNGRQLYVPAGFAHGFLATSDDAVFQYKCTAPYHPESERSIRWDDPMIGIEWPRRDVILAEKDAGAPTLDGLPADRLPVFGK